MQYLLDTNTCINLMRSNESVVRRISAASPDDFFVSTITTYELYTGVAKCAAPDTELPKVQLLLNTIAEIPFGRRAAHEAGRLRALLESTGKMIGPHDLLLAAQALVSGMVFVTGNTREFERVPGLTIEDWQS